MRPTLCFVLLTIWCRLLTFYAESKDLQAAGIVAKKGQFPYMVQIAEVASNKSHSIFSYICGASLISRGWILTAGQCFPSGKRALKKIIKNHTMIVIMGSVKSLDFSEQASRRFIEKIIRHPNYQDVISGELEAVSDDIAVAKLNKCFILNRYIQLVPLASPVYLKGKMVFQQIGTCTVMGFGGVDDGDRKPHKDSVLTYNDMKIVNASEYSIPETSNVFASASDPNLNKNHGDIGSPVMCMNLQFGLVSALVIVSKMNVDLYTQIEYYRGFITNNVPQAVFTTPHIRNKKGKTSTATRIIQKLLLCYLKLFSGLSVVFVFTRLHR